MGLNREELRKSAREWVKESMRTGKDAEGLARSMQSIVHRISWVRDDQLHQGVDGGNSGVPAGAGGHHSGKAKGQGLTRAIQV